jgi:hypothetical protein
VRAPERFPQRQAFSPAGLADKAPYLLGKHPAGNGLLEGDRNSLWEYAQGATLSSVAISTFLRQCNGLGTEGPESALQQEIH